MFLLVVGAILGLLLGPRIGLSRIVGALIGALFGFIALQIAYPFFGELAPCLTSGKVQGFEWIRAMPVLCRM